MQGIAVWVWGIVAGLIAMVGLFMAGKSNDPLFAFAGYLFLLFGVVYIFALIRRYGPGGTERH